jgi:hypothetical protein
MYCIYLFRNEIDLLGRVASFLDVEDISFLYKYIFCRPIELLVKPILIRVFWLSDLVQSHPFLDVEDIS